MYKFTCLVLCAVIASLSSNDVSTEGPSTFEDVFAIIFECAKKYGVSENKIQEAGQKKDVTIVTPCFWGCCLRKTGFMNEKGQYVLNPGLSYVRKFVNDSKAYGSLETIYIIVKECETVKNKVVSDGEAGCEMGALVADCFIKEFEKHNVVVKRGKPHKRHITYLPVN